MKQTTTLSLFRFERWQDRAWALAMMSVARRSMAQVPDLNFWKLCGSGSGEGFKPIPNTSVYAILCSWPNNEIAQDRLENTSIFQSYHDRASENWTIFLKPTSVRGHWNGSKPFYPALEEKSGPLAALTRATLKPSILPKFWGRVPNISAMIAADPNVIFKIGIGEIPMLHQVTFSIWPSAQKMASFARTNGPHAEAIRAVRDGAWFKEELYARFAILGDSGTWGGTSPLQGLKLL